MGRIFKKYLCISGLCCLFAGSLIACGSSAKPDSETSIFSNIPNQDKASPSKTPSAFSRLQNMSLPNAPQEAKKVASQAPLSKEVLAAKVESKGAPTFAALFDQKNNALPTANKTEHAAAQSPEENAKALTNNKVSNSNAVSPENHSVSEAVGFNPRSSDNLPNNFPPETPLKNFPSEAGTAQAVTNSTTFNSDFSNQQPAIIPAVKPTFNALNNSGASQGNFQGQSNFGGNFGDNAPTVFSKEKTNSPPDSTFKIASGDKGNSSSGNSTGGDGFNPPGPSGSDGNSEGDNPPLKKKSDDGSKTPLTKKDTPDISGDKTGDQAGGKDPQSNGNPKKGAGDNDKGKGGDGNKTSGKDDGGNSGGGKDPKGGSEGGGAPNPQKGDGGSHDSNSEKDGETKVAMANKGGLLGSIPPLQTMGETSLVSGFYVDYGTLQSFLQNGDGFTMNPPTELESSYTSKVTISQMSEKDLSAVPWKDCEGRVVRVVTLGKLMSNEDQSSSKYLKSFRGGHLDNMNLSQVEYSDYMLDASCQFELKDFSLQVHGVYVLALMPQGSIAEKGSAVLKSDTPEWSDFVAWTKDFDNRVFIHGFGIKGKEASDSLVQTIDNYGSQFFKSMFSK